MKAPQVQVAAGLGFKPFLLSTADAQHGSALLAVGPLVGHLPAVSPPFILCQGDDSIHCVGSSA